MTEWCWLNGQIMPLSEAKVSVEDRGFQFADGVYEALRIYNGRPFELAAHLDRLERSCDGIRLKLPIDKPTLTRQILNLIAHARVRDGLIYLQVTRGPSKREHLFPKAAHPTVLFYVRALAPLPPVGQSRPYALLSVPDERWKRCWIKAIGLLPNVLARNAAADAGADEAVFVDQGVVLEGSSSNVYAVIDGAVVTHPLDGRILPGVTRQLVLCCAQDLGIPVQERPMTLDEAKRAAEVFVTSSTRELVWVSRWDDATIGDGVCGQVTMRLHETYRNRVRRATG
jgi:D-alanine transaminase